MISLPDGGRFEILQKLATGGMAQIYLARKASAAGLERLVVLKRILPHLSEDARFVEMFTQEARLAALLVHPNVAQVYDMGRDAEGNLYYAMEYVEGLDLRAIVKKYKRPLPLDIILAAIAGSAAGLHYAHTLKDPRGNPLDVVHRDVTPSNLMITYDGGVKVVDFGVAKAALEGRESTAVGVLKGKVPYMSPEQVTSTEQVDGRSDVFSLGVCLWELTTHRRLFRRDSQIESIRAIADKDAPPPSTVAKDYPEELERIVLKALARDREARYPTARALQADIEAFAVSQRLNLSSTRVAAFMDEFFSAERDAGARMLSSPGASHGSDLVTTANPTSVSESLTTSLVTPKPVPLEAEPQSGPPRGLLIAGALALMLAGGGVGYMVLSDDEPASAADAQGEGSAAEAEAAPPAVVADPSESGTLAPDSASETGTAAPNLAQDPALPAVDEDPEGDPQADPDSEDDDDDLDLEPEPESVDPTPAITKKSSSRAKKKKKTKKAWNKNALLPPG